MIRAFADFPGTQAEFWSDWAAADPARPVAAIQLGLQLGAATGYHAPLVSAIRAAYPDAASLRALTLELDASRIAELMAGAPPNVAPGETPEAATRRHAATVSGALDLAHPTAAVARFAGVWAGEAPEAVTPGAAALMRRIVLATDYRLGAGTLDVLAQDQGDALFEGIGDPSARTRALADVQRIERLYNVSATPDALAAAVKAMGTAGPLFRGAFDIGALGKERFLAAFPGLPQNTMTSSSQVHDNAEMFAESCASMAMAALHESADPAMAATGPHAPVGSIPDWARLFGNDRLTACDECRSLGGPASYLVQILEFLDKRCAPNAAGATPLDVLIGNPDKGVAGVRPDLAHIKLSCENTDTTLPEIDLANEVLESCLVFGASLANPPNDSAPGMTADELAAAPEHVQDKAYGLLGKAVYPIALPFDRTSAEARAYLGTAGSSREALIALLTPDDADGLARERLGLTPLDWAILIGAAAPETPTASLFGPVAAGVDPENGWAGSLDAGVSAASARLGLGVADLLVLCASDFVGGSFAAADRDLFARLPLDTATFTALRAADFAAVPQDVQALLDWLEIPVADLAAAAARNATLLGRAIVADPPGAPTLDVMRLVHRDGTPLVEADWLRLHRMARLAQRSGIALADLDLALRALGADGALDAARLRALGALASLGRALSLDWPTLAGLVGGLPADVWRRCLVRNANAGVDPTLMPGPDGRISPPAGETLAGHAAALAAALERPVPEILGLAGALGLDALDEASVTALWRVVRFGRALDLAPGDLLLVADLGGQAFPTDPAALLSLAARARLPAPLTGEALRFAGSRPAAGDAAALERAEAALGKAIGGLAPGADARQVTLETLADAFSVPLDALTLLARNKPAPDPASVQRLALLIAAFGLKPSDLIVLDAAGAFPARDASAKALLAAFGGVQAYDLAKRGRTLPELALALAALATPRDAAWAEAVAGAVAASRAPKLGETDAATQAARHAVAANVRATLAGSPSWLPASAAGPLAALAAIDERLALAERTGTRIEDLARIAAGGDPAASALATLRQGVQSRYDRTAWLQVSRLLNDPLREARRDALVALLKQQRGLPGDEAVYESLLMDPGINSAVLTSRISNAMRTVQRFVSMVRLGRWSDEARPESERLHAAQINPEWDRYLHSFRLTQANFEVLSAPYFYMTPELRDDKTPQFKQTEDALRQGECTPEAIEQAFLTYLERLGEIANLEICGTYLQEDDFAQDEAFRFKNVLHVFGRSRGGARRDYYYRRLNRYEHMQEWTPWQPVKLDIQAVERDRGDTRASPDDAKPEAGLHLLPVVWQRKLHIFWPSFVRKIETAEGQSGIDIEQGTVKTDPPKPYWEVKLNWSSFANGAWSPRQTSSDYHETMVSVLSAGA